MIRELPRLQHDRRVALVVIPTYNEAGNLPSLLSRIWAAADVDVLVIDDGSPDGTGRIAEQIARSEHRLRVIHRPGKEGLASARVLGFEYAVEHGYEVAVEMDADLSHPPEALPRILEAGSHADVVIGSRRVGEGRITGRSRWRNALTILGAVYARAFLRLPVRDCTGGYRLIRVAQLRDVSFDDIRSCGYAYIIEVNHALNRLGATFAEVPIVFRDRTVGESKISFRIIIEAFMVVPKLRFGFVSTATHRRSEPAVGSTEQIVLVGRVGTQPVRTRDDRSHPALQELPL